jgi:small-conductance mechanosensitive channel
LCLLFVVALSLPSIVWAHSETGTEHASPRFGIPQTAPVVVNGEVQCYVVGVSAYPAERRARVTARRIEALAEDPTFDPKTLRVEDSGEYHEIFPGKRRKAILAVVEADAEFEGVNRTVLALTLKDNIAAAIEAYRNDRKPAVLANKALHALARTAVLIALVYGVFWGFRRLNRILEQRVKRRIKKLEAQSQRILKGEQIWAILRGALRVLQALIVLFLVYLFVNFVLSLFPWTRQIARTLLQFVAAPLGDMAEAVIDFIPHLVFLVVLFFITRYGLKLARTLFSAIDDKRVHIKGFEAEWAWPTYRIARVVIIIFAVVIAYPHIPGSDSDAFKGISILLGVLFSLGSTSVISNLMAGYTMTYRRAFRIGDRVKIGDTVGDVTEMRVLVTHLQSLKNEEVVLPNSTILNGEVVNYSTMARDQGLILHTTVGIGYDVPWRQVETMLLQAAERTAGILKEPKPFVLQKSLTNFSVSYELNAYCGDAKQMMALYNELHRNIQDVFNEHDIQIMTPSYWADSSEPKTDPREQWQTPPATELEPEKS